MSEYIQSTSRVGRGNKPGLIINILNEFKPRDKSHYENFIGIHNNLYRYIESTSVTPFSPRSRQKLLPVILIAISVKRLNLFNKGSIGVLKPSQIKEIEEIIIPEILLRVRKIDPLEEIDTEKELHKYLKRWIKRGETILWDDTDEYNSLLISSEARAAMNAIGRENQVAFQSPNSCRTVEPSVQLRAWSSIKSEFLNK